MRRIAIFLLACLAAAESVRAQAVDWPTLQAVPIAAGLVHPTYLTSPPDGSGRLFVTQHPGQVAILSGTAALPAPFLDISSEVYYNGECGLLCIAFPPDFATSGQFYVTYNRAQDCAENLSRFQVSGTNPNIADPTTEQVLLTTAAPNAMHNGGQLQFGPDGYLYYSRGDAGPQGDPGNHAQSLDTLWGKLLRLDVSTSGTAAPSAAYAIPPTNPFAKRHDALPEIWAWGLRNPWRFSFDSQTGDLYIGDVGYNSYEEVDFQPAGRSAANYGWRVYEGTHLRYPARLFPASVLASMTRPIAQLSHQSLTLPGQPWSNASIGGYVYRGATYPRMRGMYFWADYVSGCIWGIKRVAGRWLIQLLVNTGCGISSFGQDENGELYVVDYNGGGVYRLQDSEAAFAPAILPDGGNFTVRKQAVLRTITPGAAIHYTLNGIDPVETDPSVPNGGHVLIGSNATLKARAFRTGLQPSAVVSGTFWIGK